MENHPSDLPLENVVTQNTQIKKTSKIPKMASGILVTIVVIVIGWLLLPEFWFWVGWEVLAALLVAIGCGGEWWLFIHAPSEEDKATHRRKELQCISVVAIGVTMEFLALFHVIPSAMQLEKDVALANSRASSNDLQVASLNKSIIQLAHQYDLSTNALAEANARLSAIRPLKQKLVDFLDAFNPLIITALRGGQSVFKLNAMPVYKFNQLAALVSEPDSNRYVESVKDVTGHMISVLNGEQVRDLEIGLNPELAQ